MTEEQNPQPASSPSLPKLISVGELFSQTWKVYRSRFGTFFSIAVVPMLVGILGLIIYEIQIAPIALFFALGGKVSPSPYIFFVVISGLLILVASVLLSILSAIALIYAVSQPISIIHAYRFAFAKMFSILWIVILNTLMVLGGAILFIIPGIIFWVWFGFTSYILVYEDLRGTAAFLRSKSYVRGYWWPVFGRLLLLTVIGLGIFFVVGLLVDVGGLSFNTNVALYKLISQILSQVFVALIMPFIIIYTYLLYHDLATKKAVTLALQPKEKKGLVIAASIFGILIILVFLFLIFLLTYSDLNSNQRDLLRRVDLLQIQAGIETYHEEYNKYPSSLNDLLYPKYLPNMRIKDRSTHQPYEYELQSGGKDYLVCAHLESTTTLACATSLSLPEIKKTK